MLQFSSTVLSTLSPYLTAHDKALYKSIITSIHSCYYIQIFYYSVGDLLLLLPFNGLFSRTTWVRRYQKGKTNLDFTGARDSEWQWHQLGHMQVCTSLQTDNHARTPPLCFLQAGCPSCRPTNSVKALKALKALKVKRKPFGHFMSSVWRNAVQQQTRVVLTRWRRPKRRHTALWKCTCEWTRFLAGTACCSSGCTQIPTALVPQQPHWKWSTTHVSADRTICQTDSGRFSTKGCRNSNGNWHQKTQHSTAFSCQILLLFFRQQLRFIFSEKLTWRFCLNHKFTKKIKIKDVKMTNGNIN